MPIGKSGRYYSNPSVMRQHGDEPSSKKATVAAKSLPDSGINGNIAAPDATSEKAKGEHELQIRKREDGSLSLNHIHPDGFTEEHDPTTPDEVSDHVNRFLANDEPATDEADQETAQHSPNESAPDQQ
jgi:hypothetical protein